jgi:hypothetical protein
VSLIELPSTTATADHLNVDVDVHVLVDVDGFFSLSGVRFSFAVPAKGPKIQGGLEGPASRVSLIELPSTTATADHLNVDVHVLVDVDGFFPLSGVRFSFAVPAKRTQNPAGPWRSASQVFDRASESDLGYQP